MGASKPVREAGNGWCRAGGDGARESDMAATGRFAVAQTTAGVGQRRTGATAQRRGVDGRAAEFSDRREASEGTLRCTR